MPGETIFTDIETNTKDLRFTTFDVIKVYSEIYDNMPSEKNLVGNMKIVNGINYCDNMNQKIKFWLHIEII